jgi:hypothetical protein
MATMIRSGALCTKKRLVGYVHAEKTPMPLCGSSMLWGLTMWTEAASKSLSVIEAGEVWP